MALGATALPAQQDPPQQGPDAQSAASEQQDLLVFEELPVVVTATRRPRPINQAPVPVAIVSASDIHHSGLTNLPEVLQFAPGIDMLRADRKRYAVGIRGLHNVTSDRTIALVDGRNASSPMFGGPELLRLPLFLEDIERIEVVRGPGGAAWGANAFNGVLNIITKAPKDSRGLTAHARVNEFGDSQYRLRWADVSGGTSWRMTAGYEALESSQAALTPSSFSSQDSADEIFFDGKLVHELSSTTTLSAGAGYSDRTEGDVAFLGLPPGDDGYRRTLRTFARVDQRLDDNSSGYLQVFYNREETSRPAISIYDAEEFDVESQLNLDLGRHELSFGGNVRLQRLDTDPELEKHTRFPGGRRDEYWAGLFLADKFRLDDDVTLDAQVRGDWFSETHADWSGRLSSQFALDAEHRHISRVSVARAFRAPQSGLGQVTSLFRLPNGIPFAQFGTNDDLDHEHLTSFELGHIVRLSPSLSCRVDAFAQEYNHLIGYVTLPGAPPTVISRNLSGAKSRGAEFEAAWQSETLRVSGWYGYTDFATTASNQSLRAYEPARHKVGATVRWSLPEQLTCNVNYKFTDQTPFQPFAGPATAIDSFHRLDLVLSKRVRSAEFAIGVTDVFDESGVVVSAHPTPGRTFFARLQLTF